MTLQQGVDEEEEDEDDDGVLEEARVCTQDSTTLDTATSLVKPQALCLRELLDSLSACSALQHLFRAAVSSLMILLHVLLTFLQLMRSMSPSRDSMLARMLLMFLDSRDVNMSTYSRPIWPPITRSNRCSSATFVTMLQSYLLLF